MGLFGKGLIKSLWCSASFAGDLMLNTLSPHFHQAWGSPCRTLSARRFVSIGKQRERERFERSGRVSPSDLNVTGLILCPWCHQDLLLMYHICNRVRVLEQVCLKIQAKRYFCSDTVWAGSYKVKMCLIFFFISFECMCKPLQLAFQLFHIRLSSPWTPQAWGKW